MRVPQFVRLLNILSKKFHLNILNQIQHHLYSRQAPETRERHPLLILLTRTFLGKSLSGGWQHEPLTQCPVGIRVSRAQSAFLSTLVGRALSPERPGSLASRVWHMGERTSLILQAAWPRGKKLKVSHKWETFLHTWQSHSARAWLSSDCGFPNSKGASEGRSGRQLGMWEGG